MSESLLNCIAELIDASNRNLSQIHDSIREIVNLLPSPKAPKEKPTMRKEVIRELIEEFQEESSELLAQICSQDKAARLAHGEEDESRYGGLLWTIQNLEGLLEKETK